MTGCGADGSALPWGGRGRRFKSGHSDQKQAQFRDFFEAALFVFFEEFYSDFIQIKDTATLFECLLSATLETFGQ